MPLVAAAMKAKMQTRIHQGLKRTFSPAVNQGKDYSGIAEEFWEKLADAISDIAMDVVSEIQQNAEVVPGQQVTTQGGPTNQAGQTVSPGKIL